MRASGDFREVMRAAEFSQSERSSGMPFEWDPGGSICGFSIALDAKFRNPFNIVCV